MKVEKRRDPLRAVVMSEAAGYEQQSDGIGVLSRFLRSDVVPSDGSVVGCSEHWKSITLKSLRGCGLTVFPVALAWLPVIEKLYLDKTKLTVLPPEVGEMKNREFLSVDNNLLVSVPAELRECLGPVELSLEHKKLVRPVFDFRAMAKLEILRLFGNPLEFLPEILPLKKLHHLSMANIRIVADEILRLFGNPLEFLPEILPLKKLHHLSMANIRIVADEILRLFGNPLEFHPEILPSKKLHHLSMANIRIVAGSTHF